jgi:hypothetical protein
MEQKVINPITKKYIKINGPTYNQLIDNGYTVSYLNSLKNKEDLYIKPDQFISFNNDMMSNIIVYLDVQQLYTLYHTSKLFEKLLNDPHILHMLNEKYNLENYTTFIDFIDHFINIVIKKKWDRIEKHYRWESIIHFLNIIKDEYNKNNKLTGCRTRKLTETLVCKTGFYLRFIGYDKEIDLLASSRSDNEYKINLYQLEYAIYNHMLSLYVNNVL